MRSRLRSISEREQHMLGAHGGMAMRSGLLAGHL
jgi:hypothetical protein